MSERYFLLLRDTVTAKMFVCDSDGFILNDASKNNLFVQKCSTILFDSVETRKEVA